VPRLWPSRPPLLPIRARDRFTRRRSPQWCQYGFFRGRAATSEATSVGAGDAKPSLLRISVRGRGCRRWRVFPSVPFPGVLGGGQIGCNYQFAANWVIGVEGDGSAADIQGRRKCSAGYVCRSARGLLTSLTPLSARGPVPAWSRCVCRKLPCQNTLARQPHWPTRVCGGSVAALR
jgi:hypothetical protein